MALKENSIGINNLEDENTVICVDCKTAARMMNLSEPTFRQIVHSVNHPPFIKIGATTYRFPIESLKAWAMQTAEDGTCI